MHPVHFSDNIQKNGRLRLATRCGVEILSTTPYSEYTEDITLVTCAACRNGLALAPLEPELDDTRRDPVVEAAMEAARDIAGGFPLSLMVGKVDQRALDELKKPGTIITFDDSPAERGNPDLPWRCFHCDEVFSDARTAADHFGTSENDTPACLEIASETEKAIVEDRRMWRNRALDAETNAAHLEQLVHEHEHDIHFLFKDCKSLRDVAQLVDSLRGEVLANQEQADRYRWLREHEVAVYHDVGRTSPHDFKPIEESGDLLDAAVDRARLQW